MRMSIPVPVSVVLPPTGGSQCASRFQQSNEWLSLCCSQAGNSGVNI